MDDAMRARIRQENEELSRKIRARREEAMRSLQKRTPIFPDTGERGSFRGILNVLGRGQRVYSFPIYTTPGGITFREREDPEGNTIVRQIDLEAILASGTAHFKPLESLLGTGENQQPESPKE